MEINISLCESDSDEFKLNLSEKSFLELWIKYLQLPDDRNVFSPKEVVDSIDKNLAPDYSTEINEDLLENIKTLENICVMGLMNEDQICLRIKK